MKLTSLVRLGSYHSCPDNKRKLGKQKFMSFLGVNKELSFQANHHPSRNTGRSRQSQPRSAYLKQKTHWSHTLVGTPWWQFRKMAEGWGQTNRRVKNCWGWRHSRDSHTAIGFKSRNPTRFSWWRSKKAPLLLWQREGTSNPSEICSETSPEKRTTWRGLPDFSRALFQL